MKLLITGTAGFIGYHLVKKMIPFNWDIVGLDIINDYYDVNIKYNRLKDCGIPKEKIKENTLVQSESNSNYSFIKLDLADKEKLEILFKDQKFDYVCNLAAQAGVRYSLTNPEAYMHSNIIGFQNLLEMCRHYEIKHLLYASSSSVYGLNESQPFSVQDNVDHPISLYAASKKSNELMAHCYSHLFNLATTGLRFFTVYGPWGRPDMALFLFTEAMLKGEAIKVFNNGNMRRDFTYVDDIVEAISRIIPKAASGNTDWDGRSPDPSSSPAPYRLFNIGNNSPVELMDFVKAIENKLGIVAKKDFLPLQAGDVPETSADVKNLYESIDFKPNTSIEEGISHFINWYKQYYKV